MKKAQSKKARSFAQALHPAGRKTLRTHPAGRKTPRIARNLRFGAEFALFHLRLCKLLENNGKDSRFKGSILPLNANFWQILRISCQGSKPSKEYTRASGSPPCFGAVVTSYPRTTI